MEMAGDSNEYKYATTGGTAEVDIAVDSRDWMEEEDQDEDDDLELLELLEDELLDEDEDELEEDEEEDDTGGIGTVPHVLEK